MWNKIINECGLENLVSFAYGNTTGRNFSRFGTNCRTLLRNRGVDQARLDAQRAVRHRTNRKQRNSMLS